MLEFGKPKREREITDPGLHYKVPFIARTCANTFWLRNVIALGVAVLKTLAG